MGVRRDEAEADLVQWRANNEQRDDLVRKADKAGVSINKIHTLSGIGRSTIYRILKLRP
ncbi:helix-turn-helix domain-containing protein [Mycobacterium intracellulare]|uniref:helix-turn-helix domain-containing protein n=1 Tax=Mycobacterium intracellulare TaxID=1767 RepID=UPI002ECC76DB|nr:helix-turn-helix domain-containing protein [Mycobacterium intracellulare]